MIRRAFRIRHHIVTASAFAWVSLMTSPAWASGSSMPWEAPLQSILESVEGPVAKIVAVIIIIVTGLTLAFGDTSGGFRRLIQIVFGLSIAKIRQGDLMQAFDHQPRASVLPAARMLLGRSCSAI